MKKSIVSLSAIACCLIIAGTGSHGADEKKGEKPKPIQPATVNLGRPVDFEEDILPILDDNCIACHNLGVAEGKLNLEEVESILKGGKHGAAVVPKNPEKSLLFQVASRGKEPAMPPLPNKVEAAALTPKQLGLLKQWILEGAVKGAGGSKKVVQWQPLPSDLKAIYSTALSPWGRLAASGRANQIAVYDIVTAERLTQLIDPALGSIQQDGKPMYGNGASHRDFVHSLAFNHDATLLASGGYRVVKLWQRPTNVRTVQIPSANSVTAVAVSADGAWVAVGAADNSIKLFNTNDGKPGKVLAGHTAGITGLHFWPTTVDKTNVDRALDVAKTALQTVLEKADTAAEALKQFDPKFEKLDAEAAVKRKEQLTAASAAAAKAIDAAVTAAQAAAVAQTTFDKKVTQESKLFSSSLDKSIRVWKVADGALLGRIDTPAAVNDVTVNNDATQIISAGADNLLRSWTVPTGPAQQLTGAAGPVPALTVSPDKKWLALAGTDGKVVLVDLSTGKPAKTLTGHQGAVHSVSFSANSARLASGGADKTVRVWDVASGQPVAVLSGGGSAVSAVALHPNGNQVASGGADNRITVWKLDVPAARALAGDNGAPVTVSAVSPNGKLLAVGATSGGKSAILIRDIASGNVTKTLLGHEATVTALAFSADNSKIVSGSADKTARVFNLADGKELAKFVGHTAAVTGVAFNSNAQQVASGSADKSLKLWNVADSKELKNFAGHGGAIVGVAMTANNQSIVSASADQTIRVWNPGNGQQVRSIAHGQPVTSLSLSRDATRIAATGTGNDVKLYQLSDGKLLATLVGHTAAAKSVSFSADNSRLVSAAADKSVIVWDVATGTAVERLANAKGVTFAAFTGAANAVLIGTDDKVITAVTIHYERSLAGHTKPITALIYEKSGNSIFSASEDGTIRRFQTANGQQQFAANHGAAVHDLALSANGQWLASAGENKQVRVWNAANGSNAPKPTLAGFEAAVRSVCFTLDSTRVIGGAANNQVFVFNLATGALEQKFNEHSGSVEALAAAGEKGNQIISSSADKSIRSWSLSAVRQLAGHSKPVTSVALIRPAGTQIVSGSEDGTVRTWDLNTGRQIRSMNHGGPVTAVAARPDGQLVASAGANNVAKLWQVSNGKQLVELKGDLVATRKVTSLTDEQTVAKQKVALADTALKADDKNVKDREASAKKATDAKTAADKALVESQKKAKTATDALTAAKAALEKKKDDKGLQKKVTGTEKAATAANDVVKKAMTTQAATVRSVGRADKAVVTAKAKLAATKTHKDAADAYQKKIDASLAEAKKAEPAAAKPIRAIAFSPNGKKLATAGDDNIVHLWDGNQGIQLETLTGHTAVVGTLSFGIGSTLVSGSADKSVAVWDTNPSWKLIGQLGPKKETPADLSSSVFADRVLALDFSEDGKLLATGGGDPSRSGELMIWDVEKQSLVREVKDAHSDTVFGVEFSRDGKHILSGAADKFVKMFDLATGKHVRSFEGHTHHVLDVSWQADGSSIASAGADNVIKIWNVETGEQRRTISGYAKQVTSVHYVGVGQDIISCSGDMKVRFHQTSNGRNSRTFSGGTDYMYSADATRDQTIVVAGGEDGVFRVWNGKDGKVIATFAPPKPPVEIPKDSKQASTSAVGGQK